MDLSPDFLNVLDEILGNEVVEGEDLSKEEGVVRDDTLGSCVCVCVVCGGGVY